MFIDVLFLYHVLFGGSAVWGMAELRVACLIHHFCHSWASGLDLGLAGWIFLPHALFALHYPSATYVLLFYGLPRPHPLFWRPLWP